MLLKARGPFFEQLEAGGQAPDFLSSIKRTKDEDHRLRLEDDRVVQDGHYMWFKRLSETRLAQETPDMSTWPLTSRVVTAPGSVNQNASGTATPNRVRMSAQTNVLKPSIY